MIRFAVIGTNWITARFVDAAHESGKMKLVAVYSRKLDQAQTFGDDYHVTDCFDNLEALAASDLIDAVYIASRMPCIILKPNSSLAIKSTLFAKSR